MPRHLITCALPCVNEAEHLDSLASALLPADVYSRFLRARGEQVLFVCATNEHGVPVELAAVKAGLGVTEYCAQRYRRQVSAVEGFGVSLDALGRSSSPQSRQQTQYFARRLDEEGYVEARSMHRSVSPDGRHLFLLQSKLAGELRVWLESRSEWPPLPRSMALEWLDRGLPDRNITQALPWGIPVNRFGFERDVYDGWFDAPIAYIGAAREWADSRGEPGAWRRWWCASEEVRYVQFVARNNILCHAIGFPCTIIGSREPWKLVDLLRPFDRVTYYGQELSACKAVGVRMDQALDLLPPDCWRYYLLAIAPETDDTSFTWEGFALAVNEDLVATVGHFIGRSLEFAQRYFGDVLLSGGEIGREEAALVADIDIHIEDLTARMSALEFRRAVLELRAAWNRGSVYFERKRPWATVKTNPKDAALTMRTCINLIALLARLSAPVLPFTAERVLDALRVHEERRTWPTHFDARALEAGHVFGKAPALFRQIGKADVERWRACFGAPGVARPRVHSDRR